MARADDTKERRIEFLTATPEQKQEVSAAAEAEGIKVGGLIRKALDEYLHGEPDSNPELKHRDKRIADLESDIENLRGTLSLKTRASDQVNRELKIVRARLVGDLGVYDRAQFVNDVTDLIQTAGDITRQELLAQIQHKEQIPDIVQVLKDLEYQLHRDGRITYLSGGVIQWLR